MKLTPFIFLFTLLSFTIYTSAQEQSPERKVYTLKNLESDVFKLPYEMDYITNTLFPQVQGERSQLAPHYPDIATLERDRTVIDQAFINWVTTYPGEYDAYKGYLETFLRSHVNH